MSTKGKVSIALFVGGAFFAGVLFATAGANLFGAGDLVGTSGQAASLDGSTAIEQEAAPTGPRSFQTAFTEVSESVNPAVVQIRAQKVVERRMQNPFEGTPFEDFFGGPRRPDREGPIRQGLGSGVVIRSDGHIVTNNHVVENADQLSVVTLDGSEYDAEIVGTDPFSDLAVIKVDATGLTSISIGNSDELQTGQWVLAFGSPLSRNLNNSVTAGIVSAIGRLQSTRQRRRSQQDREISPVQNFVQTDAAINPGNSGGPLVNLDGELVGINTAIASQTGGYQGIGFAIPSNTVERVAIQLIEEGEVRRAHLGVSYQPASQSLVKNEDLPSGAAVIGQVEDGSPADKAGLEPSDVVIAVNGEALSNYLQIGNKIASMRPGDEVTLTIRRNGEKKEITATLEAAGAGDEAATAEGDTPSEDQLMEELGLSVRNLTPEIARRFGLNSTNGVIITDVDQSNPMIRRSGLEPRQIIIEIGGQETPDVDTFREAYAKIPAGKAFRVVVRLPQGFVDVTSLRKPE
jgi:serine protease Do